MIAVAEPVLVGISDIAASAGSAKIAVVFVENTLGVGNIVDSGYSAVLDTKSFMQHVDDRCQTIGGT